MPASLEISIPASFLFPFYFLILLSTFPFNLPPDTSLLFLYFLHILAINDLLNLTNPSFCLFFPNFFFTSSLHLFLPSFFDIFTSFLILHLTCLLVLYNFLRFTFLFHLSRFPISYVLFLLFFPTSLTSVLSCVLFSFLFPHYFSFFLLFLLHFLFFFFYIFLPFSFLLLFILFIILSCTLSNSTIFYLAFILIFIFLCFLHHRFFFLIIAHITQSFSLFHHSSLFSISLTSAPFFFLLPICFSFFPILFLLLLILLLSYFYPIQLSSFSFLFSSLNFLFPLSRSPISSIFCLNQPSLILSSFFHIFFLPRLFIPLSVENYILLQWHMVPILTFTHTSIPVYTYAYMYLYIFTSISLNLYTLIYLYILYTYIFIHIQGVK